MVSRFLTYGVELPAVCADYRDAVSDWPAMRDWVALAAEEPWTIDLNLDAAT